MLRHNLLVIYRNFRKFKSTFLINLIGLSTGLACALLIYIWVNDELHVNTFGQGDDLRFQVMENAKNASGITTQAATPDLLAQSLVPEIPEIECATAVIPSSWFGNFTLTNAERVVKSKGSFAGKDFFNVFPYELLQGDAAQVLKSAGSVVISEQLAMRIFNTTDGIVGKPLEWGLLGFTRQATVSGIFKGVPSNSTEQFDFVLSFDEWVALSNHFQREMNWDNHGPSTYAMLKSGSDARSVNGKIAGFIKARYANSAVTLFMRRYADSYLYNGYENGVLTGGRIEYVRLLSLIAVFIVVIACINFMNLSTAKASARMKEVGIRKTIGATRKALVFQFLGESFVLTISSLIFAVAIVEIFLPRFSVITGKHLSLAFDAGLIAFMLGLTLLTALIAGSYPAIYLSALKPVVVLKGKLAVSAGALLARKGLVVFQFTISIVLVVAVLVVRDQMEYVRSKNLGYVRDNVIYFDKEGLVADNSGAFLTEVRRIPGIVDASLIGQNIVGLYSSTIGLSWEGKKQGDPVLFADAGVEYGMIETLGITVTGGRSFSREHPADSSAIIFNEAAIAVMGLKDPVGKSVTLWGKTRQIIGVVGDFNFESLHERVKPLFFFIDPPRTLLVMARIRAGMEKETLDKLRELYRVFNPGFSFDYRFLDQDYEALYSSETRVAELSRYFAGLAIIISSLGLFGLAAFAAERRVKEIGIRKVLGASIPEIIFLISGDLAGWVLMANLIAWPAAYLGTSAWLNGFAYRAPVSVWVYVLAGSAAMIVALVTVSFQAVKAARANPVESLRYE
jgi:ABC-type antimicrobial peptide transport system permease subunit